MSRPPYRMPTHPPVRAINFGPLPEHQPVRQYDHNWQDPQSAEYDPLRVVREKQQ